MLNGNFKATRIFITYSLNWQKIYNINFLLKIGINLENSKDEEVRIVITVMAEKGGCTISGTGTQEICFMHFFL